ncbi:D-ribose-binding periplasmic protein, partial [Vibrio parahaemolyticus VP2007-007]
RCEGKRYGASC